MIPIVLGALTLLAVGALSEYVRRCHPARWQARTGLHPITRLPVARVEQLTETRRRAGTESWRTR